MSGAFINPVVNSITDLTDDLGLVTMREYNVSYIDMKDNDNMYSISLPEGYIVTDINIDIIEPFTNSESDGAWNTATISDTTERYWSVCCNDEIFVATSGNTNSFIYSYDGMTWNETIVTDDDNSWYAVCYGNDRFVAVGDSGYIYSMDGVNWVSGTISNTSRLWRAICYGNGRFVAMAQDSTYSAWSSDGANWTEINMANSGISSNYWYAICYGNGKFIASALDTKIIYSTDNGTTWSYSNTICSYKKYWYTSCYANGVYIIAGYRLSGGSIVDDNDFAYSYDGITWTEGKISTSARYWRKVFYGDGKFIISADNSYFAYSYDGINWTETQLSEADKRYEAICYGNDRFVAIAQNTNLFSYYESTTNRNFEIITNTGETLFDKACLDVRNCNTYGTPAYYSITGISREIILNHNLRNCVSGDMRILFKLIRE